ncbi:MAG: pyridoxal phosphate-dependent aminotransferase [Bacteroidales bacterium]|nr:pyridoxal phosphate-dependent aminotransferase [Bacteroidales bacterium]
MGEIILSDRVLNMAESATLAMTNKSRELKAQGIDVISLSIGEPDFNTPESAKQAGIDAINNNDTHYPPVPGTPALRKAVAEKLKRDNGLDYKDTEIIISNGAKQAITNTFLAILNNGDEVIIPAPFWVSYPEMVKLGGGVPVIIKTDIEHDFKITAEQLEAAITPKTKAFIINTPCNPSGSVFTKAELTAIAGVLAKHPNIIVISDEIYEYIQYNQKHESMGQFTELKDRMVIVNGVAKGYAMTGWRIGYIAAPQAIVKATNKIQGQYTSGICTIAQAAALKAMELTPENSPEIQAMLKAFRKRRDMLHDMLNEIPGVKCNMPAGAFYVFPEVKSYYGKTDGETTIKGSDDLCMFLLYNAHVACVAGNAFGNDDCIRLSYATSEDKLIEAVKRIKAALAKLH